MTQEHLSNLLETTQETVMPKLTKRFVESLIPDPKKTIIAWDTELKGFGVVLLPSGRLTYCLQYRNNHRIKKRIKIGVHGQITAEEARTLARKYFSMVVQGDDPAEEKRSLKHLPTIQELAQEYIERYGPRKRPRSLKEDQKLLKNLVLPVFASKKVAHLTRREIESFHSNLKSTPYQANRALALLSKMFSLAVTWEWRTDNPVKGMARFPEEKRDRWLDKEEISRLWAILDTYSTQPSAFFFKVLLLTGARKNELLQATWDHFDLEKGVWTKPSSLTKQKKREHLPLSEEAIQVLQNLKELNLAGPYMFPGQKGGPLKNVQTLWENVIKKADLQGVRIHDLRHTHASHLVSSGLSLSIVGKLLGHSQLSTTQRYAHLADGPLRHAASVFGNTVKEAAAQKTIQAVRKELSNVKGVDS